MLTEKESIKYAELYSANRQFSLCHSVNDAKYDVMKRFKTSVPFSIP